MRCNKYSFHFGVLAFLAAMGGVWPANALASASAQNNASTEDAKFKVEEAAYCAATYGWIMEYLIPNGMPKEAAIQAEIAFLIWGYELGLSAPNAVEEERNQYASAAIAKLTGSLPEVTDEATAKTAIDKVIAEAAICADKVKAKYPDGLHPVVIALEEEAKKKRMLMQDQAIPLK